MVLVVNHDVEQQVVLLQYRRYAGQKPARQRIGVHRHAQSLPAQRLAAAPALQAVQQISFHQPHLPHMAEQRLAGWRGAHLLAAHQQPLAHCVFKRLDAQRHGGQRQAEGFGGGTKTAVFNDGSQGIELAGIEHKNQVFINGMEF